MNTLPAELHPAERGDRIHQSFQVAAGTSATRTPGVG